MIVLYVVWTASLTAALSILSVAAPGLAAMLVWGFAAALMLGVAVQWARHGAPHIRHRTRRQR